MKDTEIFVQIKSEMSKISQQLEEGGVPQDILDKLQRDLVEYNSLLSGIIKSSTVKERI